MPNVKGNNPGQWMNSRDGIEQAGALMGMSAFPGESHDDYKTRILAAMQVKR